jgi:hypothetical protein
VSAGLGQTVPVASFGSFHPDACLRRWRRRDDELEIVATSSEASSDLGGTLVATAGVAQPVVADSGAATGTFSDVDDNVLEFLAPSRKSYEAGLTVGNDFAGHGCFANALIAQS